ncbi:MAG: trigger factor [Lachnospiraceae bacterium]|nr:trigger factor [Lachnospiraceae bacterium]
MKKKLVALLMVMALGVLAVGCGDKKEASKEADSKGSEYDLYDGEDYKIDECVELANYKGLDMEVTEVADSDVDAQIQSELENNKTYNQIKEGKVKDGDTVNIDYVGKKDGKEFDGGSATGYDLTIGSNTFIPGFESGLVGKKVGETVDINVTFPEEYQSEELAGQPAVFTVTINYIRGDEIKQELNDEYVTANTEYKTVDEYKKATREQLETNNLQSGQSALWGQVVSSAVIMKYPDSEVKNVLSNLKNYCEQMASMYGVKLDEFLSQNFQTTEENFDNDMLDNAKQQVAAKLVALKIAKDNDIVVSEDEYDNNLASYVQEYGYSSAEEMENTIGTKELRQQMLIEKAMNFVYDNAKRVDKPAEATENTDNQ